VRPEAVAEIQRIRKRYPRSRSAVMDALRIAQTEHGGWLPPEAFREVADALDVTPAYCHSIASFYDMYHLEPVGEHVVEVCTNLSCALAGAQAVLDAFASELAAAVAERSAELDRRITLTSDEWPADRLGTLERNILRIGVYELEEGNVPREVAINEAVVLAKRYASDDAARLVNGILGRIARDQEAA